MNEIKIRKGEEKDIEDLIQLSLLLCEYDKNNFDNTLNCDWMNPKTGYKYINELITGDNSCVFVSENKGKIVGYLLGEIVKKIPWRNIKKQAELIEIFILDEYRGHKIGNKLVGEFKKWCQENKVTNIKVLVSNGNNAGINFYKKMGFFDYDQYLEFNF